MLRHNIVAVRGVHKSSAVLKPVEKVTKLGNKLTVATIESKGPLTQLVLAFKAGSRYEEAGQSGLAHTVRNFVGRDSQQYFGNSIVWSSSAAGATMKAFTTRDLFGVALTIPRDQISSGLSILGQATAVPGFKPWEMEDVLPTMRADNKFRSPYDYVVDGIHKAAYRNGGLGNAVFSPCSKIGSISSEVLSSFAEKHFVSGNGVLFASNAVHEDVVLYGENFSPIRSGTAVNTVQSVYKGGESRREADARYAHVIISGEGAAGNNSKAVATQAVLLNALGISSPVKFSETAQGTIGQATGPNGSVSAFQAVHSDSGLAGVYLVTEAANAGAAVQGVYEALKTFSIKDFDAAKKQAYNNALRAKAHSDNYALERTSQLFHSEDNYINQIESVTKGDVESALKKLTSRISLASFGNISAVPFIDQLN